MNPYIQHKLNKIPKVITEREFMDAEKREALLEKLEDEKDEIPTGHYGINIKE